MATVTATKDNFEQLVTDNETVIVDFWAAWCGPCRQFAPTFESASEQHEEIVFAKVDTEVERELAEYFQIRAIPTLMVFKDNTIVFSQAGALPPPVFEDLIGQVKDLDMEEVHRRIAEHEHAEESA